ncbi:hypothetical protein [Acinetobacter phage AB1I1M-1]
MKFGKVLAKIFRIGKPVMSIHKIETIKKCGCPCHDEGVYISHFLPCCKYTDQKLQK